MANAKKTAHVNARRVIWEKTAPLNSARTTAVEKTKENAWTMSAFAEKDSLESIALYPNVKTIAMKGVFVRMEYATANRVGLDLNAIWSPVKTIAIITENALMAFANAIKDTEGIYARRNSALIIARVMDIATIAQIASVIKDGLESPVKKPPAQTTAAETEFV